MAKMTFNDSFFGTIGKSHEMEAMLRAKATPVLAIAQKTARVKTGRYRNSLRLRKRYAAYRVVIEVVADDPKATLLEAKYGTLARALRSAKRV